jgi:hypothetical protein
MKTKKLLLVMSLLFLIIGIGCEEEKTEKQIRLKGFSYSECKGEVSSTLKISASSSIDLQEYIEYKGMGDHYLHIKHVNVPFNCCPDTIKASASLIRNEIAVKEEEMGPKCNCICRYDLEYKIGPLLSKEYLFVLKENAEESVRFNFIFSSVLDNKYIIERK